MSLSSPKVQAPAPQVAPAMQGADALRLGVTGDPLDDLLLQGRSAALLGKARLRVGVGSNAGPGSGSAGGVGIGSGATTGTGTSSVASAGVTRPAGTPAGSTGSAASVAIGSATTSPGRGGPSKLRDVNGGDA